ncbi:MAG: WG repeat-containing protein [Bacteroidota bacterium]
MKIIFFYPVLFLILLAGNLQSQNSNLLIPVWKNFDSNYDPMQESDSIQRWGYINNSGVLKISYKYENAGDYSDGLARVQKDGLWGFINTRGQVVIPIQYDEANNFDNGAALVFLDGIPRYINKEGVTLFMVEKSSEDEWREYFCENLVNHNNNGNLAFLDKTGSLAFETPYDYENCKFSEGFCYVKLDEKYGYINNKGEMVISNGFDVANDFSENLAAVVKDAQFGYIDKKGNVKVPFQYEFGNPYHEGIAAVQNVEPWSYIDTTGNKIFEEEFNFASNFIRGKALVYEKTEENSIVGLLDKKGKFSKKYTFNSEVTDFEQIEFQEINDCYYRFKKICSDYECGELYRDQITYILNSNGDIIWKSQHECAENGD